MKGPDGDFLVNITIKYTEKEYPWNRVQMAWKSNVKPDINSLRKHLTS